MSATSVNAPGGTLHHATAIILGGVGLLITGASGSGKSRLALALLNRVNALEPLAFINPDTMATPPYTEPLESQAGASALVADDQVLVTAGAQLPGAQAPTTLQGLIEVRGLGIAHMPWIARADIHFVISLTDAATWPRLPDARSVELAGCTIANVRVPTGDLAHQMLLIDIALGQHG
ncbi:MAG: HPr kinase/phosphatase C-terminal domain-containing protein [Devosiaceae bacterium]|nr:HPr kinase/phosphatase C-terminal domain-containing protein [Devosiaceae bacterium MH13]